MCGIVGYIGPKDATPIIINGLKRLEYRGYDSAGIAVYSNGDVLLEKQAGKIATLEHVINGKNLSGTLGIGHTRWATHGEPNQINAHPHTDCNGNIFLIHNGIIENYASLKTMLKNRGHSFKTETDTEVIAHLIEEFYEGNFESAVRLALTEIQGAYGFAIICKNEPDKLIVARHGSPLVVGIGNEEYFVASDVAALVNHTRNVFYLDDNEMAIITRKGFVTKTIENEITHKKVEKVTLDISTIEKSGFPHFMLKEIFEQTQTIKDAMRGRLLPEEGTARLGGITNHIEKLKKAKNIIITACGTSWHAGLIGEYMFEEFAKIPVEVEYASEFRYRNPVINEDDVVIVISQSGETADTLAALKEAKRKGATALGICNVVGSSIARETDAGIYIHAGPEIGVASTKAFTSQVTVLALISLLIGRMKYLTLEQGRTMVNELMHLPEKVEKILKSNEYIKNIANEFKNHKNFLYLGRGYNFPVALEGALKLKEISYVHAEGYPAAEMKHGPIALIDDNMPVIFVALQDSIYQKILSNMEEVRARKGRIIAIATEGDEEIKKKAEHVIYVPKTIDFLTPILSIIPLQLLAYHIAVMRGCNVDQPRNLAKSVTVE
jgi:glucosamine--fructose-6-phosphate aminotransferase (isomerizing)